jgi:aminoglycoside phosphotransferase (APT) family kinase protein
MPGNAGLSFGFDLRSASGGDRRLVVRFAPPGVARRGNTDVLRQVPLLDALRSARIPVPAVRWSTDDPRWFGTDAFMVDWVDGGPLHMWDPDMSPAGDVPHLLDLAVDTLAAIHAVDWRPLLETWDRVHDVADELARWTEVLERAADAGWLARGLDVVRALEASMPPTVDIGLLHGDFQTNNVIYDGDVVAAVVDWELASIGPQMLDLGWLMMWCDERCWDRAYAARMRVRRDPVAIVSRYARASDRAVESAPWFEALACFRFAAIAAYNLKLHRSGRRPDPFYELLAPSVPVLLSRADELVTDRTVTFLTDG